MRDSWGKEPMRVLFISSLIFSDLNKYNLWSGSVKELREVICELSVY